MKHLFSTSLLILGVCTSLFAQNVQIKFTEYDLPNGLHVILHEDHATPIVNVSVMYHVGSKNEDPQRTGFAHFFEHLMFEGTKNIQRGEYMKLIESNGGNLNANTSHDRTYYFQTLPSHQTELALWMEAERMLHAKIDSAGIETQRKVVKEEKKQNIDNKPYGRLGETIFSKVFTKHPYQWMPIGSDQYIDAASYEEFMDFYKLFYVPNNAVLTVAGDINILNTKSWIEKYFGSIAKGTKPIPRPSEAQIEPTQEAEHKTYSYDPSIQLPALILAYHGPKMGADDYHAMSLLNAVLSTGASSRLQQRVVDNLQKAVAVGAFSFPLEDPGAIIYFGICNMGVAPEDLEKVMLSEIDKIVAEGITDKEFTKISSQTESNYVMQKTSLAEVAEALASSYTYFKNTNLVNSELSKIQKITKEDIKRVANKYLTKNNRTVIYYLPKAMENQQKPQ